MRSELSGTLSVGISKGGGEREGRLCKAARRPSLRNIDAGVRTSSLEVDDSDLDDEGAISFVAFGETNTGRGWSEVEFDCFRDDEPTRRLLKDGNGRP